MRTVTPGKIVSVTMKELSAVLAECAARTEIARAGIEEDRRKHEAVMAKHEAVMAKHEAAIAKQQEISAETRTATEKIEKAATEQRATLDEKWVETTAWSRKTLARRMRSSPS